MKRIIFVVVLLLLGAMAQAQSVSTDVRESVMLRVGAGTEWRRLDILEVGETVNLDGRITNGSWVRGITWDGQVGWLASRYLNASPGAINNLPVIAREAPITVSAPAPGAVPGEAAAAPAAQPEAAAPAAPAATITGGIIAQATANVNMRSGPSTEYRRVGGIDLNNDINIDGRNGNVTWVRGINGAGEVGWVSAQYINLGYDQVAALPVVQIETPFTLGAPGAPAAAAPGAAPAAPVDIQPIVSTAPVRGFAYGGHIRGLSSGTVNAMRQAGMTWVKKQVRYSLGNDPGGWAGTINEAHANGFRILLGVVGAPDQVLTPGYNEAYAAFSAGLAALGADALEIWNEPNLDREWPTGQVDPARYTQLLAASYNAIKGVNPNTLVISGAPAPTGAFGGCAPQGCDDNVYIQGMAAAGAANYMDCVGIHYNEGIVPPTQTSGDPRANDYYTRYYPGMVNTYYNAFGGQRPLCFTELGYLSPQGFGPLPSAFGWAGNVTVQQQATWLRQVRDIARNSGVVRLLIIWNVDFDNYGADPMAGYAIIRPGGGCPACAALGG